MGELHKRAINPVRALMLHLPEVRAGRRLFRRFRVHMRALLQEVPPATTACLIWWAPRWRSAFPCAATLAKAVSCAKHSTMLCRASSWPRL